MPNYLTFRRPELAREDQGGQGEADVSPQYYVYSLAFFAVIGSLLFGYNTGIMSGSIPLIEDHFGLDVVWKEAILTCGIEAAALSAIVAGYACDRFGRKTVIQAASLVFLFGAGVSGAAVSKEMLLVGRIVVGIAMGVASMAIPVYLAETTKPSERGRVVALSPLFMTMGIVVSGISAGAFTALGNIGWRYMHFFPMVPAFIQLIGFFFLPESPRWLMSKRKILRARRVLQHVHGTDNVEIELRDIDNSIYDARNKPGAVIMKVFRTPHVRKALLIGVSLHIVSSLSGINTVIYNSSTLLQMGGFPPQDALWLVCIPNIINSMATLMGVILVERVGRKKLLVGSLIGVVIAGMILATGFQLSFSLSPGIDPNVNETTPGGRPLNDGCYNTGFSSCKACIDREFCGFCYTGTGQSGSCLRAALDDGDSAAMFGRCTRTAMASLKTRWSHWYCPTEYNFLAVLGMAWFLLCFAPGLGPMTWTITSEIYPLWARSTCFAIGAAFNWACYLLVVISLTIYKGIPYGSFWTSAGICLVGVAITARFLPETRRKTLEETEQLFGAQEQPENPTAEPLPIKDVISGRPHI